MQPLKAHVHNGRLLLDEPTDLPEGQIIELVPVDDAISDEDDGLSDDDRSALHEALKESFEQIDNGEMIDAEDALAALRAHR
jgi:hypothetical protein